MLSHTAHEPDVAGMEARRSASLLRARHELALVCIATAAAFGLALWFDIGDAIVEWTRVTEIYELDELLFGGVVFSCGLIWFCGRRWRDAVVENALRAQLEADLAHHLAQMAGLLEDNRRLLARLSNLQEEERVHIAQELHDAFGQHLTAINANAVTAAALVTAGRTVPAELPARIIDSAQFLAGCTRAMLTNLRPPVLAAAGLAAAVEELVAEWQRQTTRTRIRAVISDSYDDLPEELALALYRIVQEALQNCVKHAAADEIDVQLERRGQRATGDAEIVACVVDNGVGYGHVAPDRGLGVLGMRERARALHGSVDVSPREPQGTVVRAVLPLPLTGARGTRA